MNGIIGTLSICRRAGKLIGGMDEVKAACRRKESKLVLVASDCSEKSYREIKYICERENVPLMKIPDTMDGIGESVGKRWGIVSVNDAGFAKAVTEKLSDRA